MESLKIKLPDVAVFNMSIFSQGNTKEYLAHIVAVLRLISQKGTQCTLQEASQGCRQATPGMLKNLQKAAWSKTTVLSKDDMEAWKLVIGQTEEMLQEA
jgi:hypothetical protein